jgi:hypothetical protein
MELKKFNVNYTILYNMSNDKESDRSDYLITRNYPNGDILNAQLDVFTVRPLTAEFYDKLITLIEEDLEKTKV